MDKKSIFDATASMLGYLYQIRFGLYIALKKLPEIDHPEEYTISIEILDDVAFNKDGLALELLQTKYHGHSGNLTDRSPDIWKTVRVWVDAIERGHVILGQSTLTLVTTESLPENTIAYFLNPESGRDTGKALELMSSICTEKTTSNEKGYAAFRSLNDTDKKALVNEIFVVGKSDNLLQVKTRICRYGRQYVVPDCVDAFVERIEGVWFQWCIDNMSQKPSGVINLDALQRQIDIIRPEYTAINLPVEFSDALPDVLEIEKDERNFIKQLRLFGAPKIMLEQALVNYFRAYEQRSKWSSDGLLEPGELCKYDYRLEEQWNEYRSFLDLEAEIDSALDKRKHSAELYKRCIQSGAIPIRNDFVGSYVAKGSYHILSDQFKIGWHCDYLSMLGESCNENVA